jgi:hypothetical protein
VLEHRVESKHSSDHTYTTRRGEGTGLSGYQNIPILAVCTSLAACEWCWGCCCGLQQPVCWPHICRQAPHGRVRALVCRHVRELLGLLRATAACVLHPHVQTGTTPGRGRAPTRGRLCRVNNSTEGPCLQRQICPLTNPDGQSAAARHAFLAGPWQPTSSGGKKRTESWNSRNIGTQLNKVATLSERRGVRPGKNGTPVSETRAPCSLLLLHTHTYAGERAPVVRARHTLTPRDSQTVSHRHNSNC